MRLINIPGKTTACQEVLGTDNLEHDSDGAFERHISRVQERDGRAVLVSDEANIIGHTGDLRIADIAPRRRSLSRSDKT